MGAALASAAVISALAVNPAYGAWRQFVPGGTLDYASEGVEGESSLSLTGDVNVTSTGFLVLSIKAGIGLGYNGRKVTISGGLHMGAWNWGGDYWLTGTGQIVNNYNGRVYVGKHDDVLRPLGNIGIQDGQLIPSHSLAGKAGNFYVQSGGTFSNSGRFYTNTNTTLGSGGVWDNWSGSRIIVQNTGVFNMSGGTLTNRGSIEIESGGKFVNRSGSFSNSGTLDASYGSLVLQSGSSISNTGTVIFGSGVTWNSGGTYVSSGGTLNTPLSYVASVGTSRKSINALRMNSTRSATSFSSDVWADVTSSINSTFKNNSTLYSGSTVYIRGSYTSVQAEKIRSVIRSYFPYATVSFESISGTGTANFSKSHAFDAKLINALMAAGYTDYTYYDRDWSGNMTAGSTVNENVGFRRVTGTASAVNGRTLELVGVHGANTVLAAAADIRSGGTLTLGTLSSSFSSGSIGSIATVANAGTLRLENGTYALPVYSGAGSIRAGAKANVTWTDFTQSGGSITNAGTMTFTRGLRLADTANTGTITFGDALTVGGSFTNTSGKVNLGSGLDFEADAAWTNGMGTVNTVFRNLFDKGDSATPDDLHTVRITAEAPEGVRTVLTERFTKYVPAAVKDLVKDHMTFTGAGNVVISDATLTTTQKDDIIAAFRQAFGTATNVTFTGTISGVSRNDSLTTAKVNELWASGANLADVVYIDRDFDAESRNALFGEGGVKHDAGFAGIGAATGVTVADGLKLVLVGEKDNADYVMTGVASRVFGAGSELRLGSMGLDESAEWRGKLQDVSLASGALLNVVSGDYTVASVQAVNPTTRVRVAEGAAFTTDGMTMLSGASFENAGRAAVRGDFEGTGGGTYTNSGTLTVEGTINAVGNAHLTNTNVLTAENGISLIGTLTNARGGTLSVTGDTLVNSVAAAFENAGTAVLNGNLSVAGSLQNSLGAVLQTNTLSVTGQINNYGLIEASDDSTLYGSLTNAGTVNLFNTVVGSAGRLTNTGLTHSITGVGTITVNGLLSNVSNADFTGEILRAEGALAEVTNASTMTLDEISVTDGAQFTNTGVLRSESLTVGAGSYQVTKNAASGAGTYALRGARAEPRASEQIRILSVASGGSKTNNGDAWYAEGTIAGTFTNGADGYAIAGISDVWPDGAGLTVTETGVVANGGTFVAGGALTNKGTIRGAGTFVMQREGAATNLFANSGSITVGTLEADGITYTQTGGTISADAGWFSNSAVNIVTGSISHETGGTGNTYVIGDGVSSGIVADGRFGTIDSASSYEIIEGGRLRGDVITLDGVTADTIKLSGGTLSTTLDQIFADVSHKAFDIDAADPSDRVDVEGVSVATEVSDIKREISTGVFFGYGTVAFDDAVYSTGLVSDVLAKLDADDVDPAGHTGELEVSFNGAAEQKFTVTLANAVRANDEGGTRTYATFAGETLTNIVNPDSGLTKLYVGSRASGVTDANVLDNSIGFKQVVGAADGVTVADAHHLVLVGEKQSLMNPDFAILDGDLTVEEAGSMVTLGTYGTTEKTNGRILDIRLADGGVLRVRHGDFIGEWLTNEGGALYIGGDGVTRVNGSLLRADTNSSLRLNGLTVADGSTNVNYAGLTVEKLEGGASDTAHDGVLTNFGTLSVTDEAKVGFVLENRGTASVKKLTVENGRLENGLAASSEDELAATTLTVATTADILSGELANRADFTVTGKTTVGGTLSNAATGTAYYADMDVTAGGVSSNAGYEEGNVLTILTGGTHVSTGTSIWNTVNVASGAEDVFGSSASGEAFAVGGSYVNDGTLNASAAESMTVTDDMTNRGTADFNELTLSGTMATETTGFTTGRKLVIADGAVHTVTGRSAFDEETVQAGGREVFGSSAANEAFSIVGLYTNEGEIAAAAAEMMTVEGTLMNRGTANYDDMTVASGGRSVNESYEKGNDLTLETGSQHENSGTSIWNSVMTAAGSTMTNSGDAAWQSASIGGVLTNSAADGHALTIGTGAAGDVFVISSAGEVTNAGTLDASGAVMTTVSGKLTNDTTGTASYRDMTIAAGGVSENRGYEEGRYLTADENGTYRNSGTSVWEKVDVSGEAMNSGSGTWQTVTVGGTLANTAAGDRILTIGTGTSGDAFTVNAGGTLANSGRLDATGTDMTTVSGTLDLQADGNALWSDMTVASGGVSANAGYEKGGELVVRTGGEHRNTGTSIWNTVTVDAGGTVSTSGSASWQTADIAGDVTNTASGDKLLTLGTGTAGDRLTIRAGGTLTNEGRLDGTGTDMATVSGTLANTLTGTAKWNDMTIASGGVSANAGFEQGDDLVIRSGGRHENTGTSIWNTVTTEAGGTDVFGTAAADEAFTLGGTYENSGRFDASEAERMTLTGAFTHNASGEMRFDALTVATGATVTDAGSGTAKTLTVDAGGILTATGTTGSMTVTDAATVGGRLAAEAGGSLTLGGPTEVLADGVLLNTLGTVAADDVTLRGNATLDTSGTTEAEKLTAEADSVISLRDGHLTVGTLDADGTAFKQTGGTLTVEKGWFTNSELHFAGGTFDANDAVNGIHDAAGNLTGDLGHNTVVIGAAERSPVIGPESELSVAEKLPWKDPYAVVHVNTLTNDTMVTVTKGGVLDVEALDFTADAGRTLTVESGGGIQVSLDQLFNRVTTTVTDIQAVDPETGKIDIVTDVLATTTVDYVRDEVLASLGLESGSVAVFDDDDFSVELVASVNAALGRAGYEGVSQHYLGRYQGDFTIDLAKRLFAEQEALGDPAVSNPGVVFDKTTFWNVSTADGTGPGTMKLVIGTADEALTDAHGIPVSMGFQNVRHADEVTVTNGHEFVLVGDIRPEDFEWTTDYDDSNKVLLDSADGGKVSIEDGIFTLGSNGLSCRTVGWVNQADLTGDAALVTKNGEFAVWTINADAGEVLVTAGSILHANTLTTAGSTIRVGGELTVGGDLTLDGTIESTGRTHYQNVGIVSGGITNSGHEEGVKLTVGDDASHVNTGRSVWREAEVNGSAVNGVSGGAPDENAVFIVGTDAPNEGFVVNGSFVNNGRVDASKAEMTTVGGTLGNSGKALYDDMTVTAGGASTNTGYEQGDILVVAGEHVNTGTSIWNNVGFGENASGVNGEAIPEGVPNGSSEAFESDAVLQIGTVEGEEHFTVDGSFTNHGILSAAEAENTIVGGSLANDGRAFYDDMRIAEGGRSENIGYEKGDILTAEGEHVNTGISIWNNVEFTDTASGVNGLPIADGAPLGHEEGFASDSIVVIGTADEENTFVIDGAYVNNGILNASETEETIVGGTLENSGRAFYDDMTVEAGGSSKNLGYEQGDILTVEGAHENSGVSIWNGIVIAEPGSAVNTETGKVDVNGRFDVEGSYENKGGLDARDTPMTNVSGDLVNSGHAEYDDITVQTGGRSENSGCEKGDILTVDEGGGHVNTGTSIWNNVTVAGDAVNDGRLEVGSDEGTGSEFVVDGGFTNNGELDATKAENTLIAGDLVNNGHAEYDDMDVASGGRSENNVYEKGDILDILSGGVWDNNGEAHWNNVNVEGGRADNSGTLDAGKIVIGDGSDVSNTGSITAGELEVNGGVLDLGAGSVTADRTVISGGDIVVGNREPLADDNRVDFDITESDSLNGHIWVIGNGDISFGKDAAAYGDAVGAPNIPDIASRITLTDQVVVGETGSIAVGSDVWTDPDHHRDVGDGNLYFGADSLTVADVEQFGHDIPMFKGLKDGATVTVEAGAKLMLGSVTEEGDYIITDGFLTGGNITDNTLAGGWTGLDLWAPNTDGSGLKWLLDLNHDEKKIWVTVTLEDVRNVYPDVSIPNNVNEALDACKKITSPDQMLTCTVIKNHGLGNAEKTQIINSVAELPFAAGFAATAFNDADAAADALESRVSMKGEHFRADGSMAAGESGKALWVDVLGGRQQANSYEATGRVSNGFESETFGFIMGADAKLEGRDVILGGAFSYSDGSLDSTGSLFRTKSEYATAGVHAYGAWKPTSVTNVVGTFSYLRHSADASMPLPAGLAFGKAEASADTDMMVLGVRGERHFAFDGFSVIPHAGLQLVYSKTGAFETKLDGAAAYRSEGDASATFRLLVGAAVRGDATRGAWHFLSEADLTLVPQFGDTEQAVTGKGVGSAFDVIEGAFTSKFTTKLDLSLRAEHANGFSAGLRWGYSQGGEGKADHTFRLEVRKTF